MGPLEADDLVGDGHRLPIALEALPRDLPLGGEPFRLSGLFQERPALRERGIHLGTMVAGEHEGITVALEPCEARLAVADGRIRAHDRLLRDAEATRVLVTLGVEVAERPVEAALDGACSPVGAADRGLEPIAQRALVTCEIVDLVVTDRRRGAEELLGRD